MTSRIMFLALGAQQQPIGMSSNGRTADSGSVNGGSTPSIPAKLFAPSSWPVRLAVQDAALSRRKITGSNPVRATKSFRDTPIVPLYMAVRLAVQDAALSRRRSPVRIWYGLPSVYRPGYPACFVFHLVCCICSYVDNSLMVAMMLRIRLCATTTASMGAIERTIRDVSF